MRIPLLLAVLICPSALKAQTPTIPMPVLISQVVVQMTSGRVVNDVRLSGTVTRTIGMKSESGTIELRAVGATESRIDFGLNSGVLSEIRTSASGEPQGFWSSAAQTNQAMAAHNCFTDPAWFFPPLTLVSQLSKPGVVAGYVGLEDLSDEAVYHFILQQSFPQLADRENQIVGPWTVEHFYVDSKTFLPVAITFDTHPDENANINIPIRIEFSNYEVVNGFSVPQRIVKYVNGVELLDITINSASVNSGISGTSLLTQ
jgi:hypothetical protein